MSAFFYVMTRSLERTCCFLRKTSLAILSAFFLVGCGGDSVDVSAPDGFRPVVPRDVVRALQGFKYELIIRVSVDGKLTQTSTGVRIDTESKTIEPISLNLPPGDHQLQLAFGAGRAVGCTVAWVTLAETLNKSITVEANKQTRVSFPDSENNRAFDDDGDLVINLDEVEANTSPCIADRPPPPTIPSVGLERLEFLSAQLDQPFQSLQKSYKAKLTFPVDRIYAVATTQAAGASIRINGVTVESGSVSPPISVPRTDTSRETTVTIMIDVSANGVTTQYTVEVTRPTVVIEQEAYVKASNTGGAPAGTPPDANEESAPMGDGFGYSLAMSQDGQLLTAGARYEDSDTTSVGGAQDNNNANDSGAAYVFRRGAQWRQEVYIKASNAESKARPEGGDLPDVFGTSVVMNGTGSTVVIGAPREDSEAGGVNGDIFNNNALDSGAVYVFDSNSTGWRQTAYIKAPNPKPFDFFGGALVMSQNSNTLVVGANSEDSKAEGIDGDDADRSVAFAGAAFAYRRVTGGWEKTAYIKASNTHENAQFGSCLALSADGNTLAVGSPREKSNAIGVDGGQANRSAADAGAVYIYGFNGVAWIQQAYIKASNTSAGDRFGCGLALSGDASYLAVGAPLEGNASTDGAINNDGSPQSGAVYIFQRSQAGWSQTAYIKSFNSRAGDQFGQVVRISADGTRLLITAPNDDGDAGGINPVHDDNRVIDVGAAYLYFREGEQWNQLAYIKPSIGDAMDRFGSSAAMSADGSVISIGTILEDSAATGIDGDPLNNGAVNSGAVYVYRSPTPL